jgi:acetyltransferase
MDIEEIRKIVLAVLASVAPDSDRQAIQPDRPLREQIDLDSLDWLNVLAGLQDKLKVDIPASDIGRLATLNSMASYMASRLSEHAGPSLHPKVDPFAALPRTVELLGDTPVTLRPIRADDAPLEADFVRRLSTESRYKRFMGTVRELPQAKLAYLTNVDSVHHVALAATVNRAGQEALVGVARYVVDAAGCACEFAVAVDDAWQGSGVAGILMQTLLEVARTRGLKRMEGSVLATNSRMLKFMRQLGFDLHHDPDDRHNVVVVRAL